MEKIITSKVRQNLDERTARIILDRSDKLANGTLEQLRNSTNRSYTMMGFLITVFVALTAFVFSRPPIWQLAVALTLWAGIGTGLYIMFSKVLWVHNFKYVGNNPRNMINEGNIERLAKEFNHQELNELYSLNTLLDAIRINQEVIDFNKEVLAERCDHIETAMTIMKCTFILATIITAISLLASLFVGW